MKNLSTVIVIITLLASGCGTSDKPLQEKGDLLSQQALQEMNRQNYEEAERLLAESITLYNEQNNEAKLAEQYSTLSTIQILSGKLTPALETLASLREIYRHGGDRSSELQTMLQISKIYFQLGKTNDAAALLTETFNNGKLFRLGHIAMTAALDLARQHASMHHYARSSQAALAGYTLAKELQHRSSIIDALTLLMNAAAAAGNTDKALTYYHETASLVSSDQLNERTALYNAAGTAFSAAGEWAFAKMQFDQVTALSESHHPDIVSSADITARIGTGEVCLHHFAYAEAQRQFIKAYNSARTASDPITQSYLLIRIGDCLSRNSVISGSSDAMIRAEQLYEQAMTLCIRSGFQLGEAIALNRLGRLKEMGQDDNGAITFYKRAFDKFNDVFVDPLLFTGSVNFSMLMNSASSTESTVGWFSNDLILQLLKHRRITEAYAYQQTVRTLSLINTINPLPIHFLDKQKERRYAARRQSINTLRQNILEAFHCTSSGTATKSRNYLTKLQQQIVYNRSKVQSDEITLAREYPSFSFLTFSKKSVPETIISALPAANAVLDFFIENNQAWVFVARPGEELAVVKLSSFGYSLESKMNRFTGAVTGSANGSREIVSLSVELNEYLLKPIDLTGIQRAIIVPPISHPQFPFHLLTDNGSPVIDKIGISYLPHMAFAADPPSQPKFINAVTAFGFTSNTRWGLEFELRDIRSFFRNIQINNNQTATKERLESSVGEIIQLSSQYSTDDDGGALFTLSDGSTSKAGVNFPVSDFTNLHPYKIVYLSDVQSTTNSITGLHPLLWLLNGSGSVIVNHYPITSAVSKTFSENFYASLASEINPFLAYRRATVSLTRKKDILQGYSGAVYFYYGVK